MSAARFDVSVAVTNTTTQVEEQPQSEKQFALSNGTYAVTLTGTGNAQTYGGYCTLTLGSDTYHTVQLRSGEQFTFTLTVTSAQTVSFTVLPQWGTYAGSAEETLIGTDSAISYTDPTGINETTDVSQTQEPLEPQQSTQPVQNTQSVQNTEDSTIDNTTDGTEETVQPHRQKQNKHCRKAQPKVFLTMIHQPTPLPLKQRHLLLLLPIQTLSWQPISYLDPFNRIIIRISHHFSIIIAALQRITLS